MYLCVTKNLIPIMSLVKFEITEEHINLLKHVENVSLLSSKEPELANSNLPQPIMDSIEEEEQPSPFGGDSLFDDMDLILNGMPKDYNPLTEDLPRTFTEEEKSRFIKIFNELKTALDIILYTGSFELGHYKTKFHIRDWKKYTPK